MQRCVFIIFEFFCIHFKTEKFHNFHALKVKYREFSFSVLNCSSLSGAGTWYDASSENVTYGSIVIVTCNSSLFMADGKTVKTVTCVDTGQWNDTVTPCTCTSESQLMINFPHLFFHC